MADRSRSRLQVDLEQTQRRVLRAIGERMGYGGDAEATRRMIEIVENLIDRIQHGHKIAVVPADDEHPDAVPELTRAFRPESHYEYLMRRPHAWRRQLSFKGRRLTVGQFLGTMRANEWTPEQAAAEYDLPVEAALEALDYGDRYASLIAAENNEDVRAAKSVEIAHPSR